MSDELTFKEYQEFATETDMFPPEDIINDDIRVWLTEYRTLCTCGEIGELSEKMLNTIFMALTTLLISTTGGNLANKVKKIRRDFNGVTDEVREQIEHEVGDILWYLSTLCTIVDLDLGEVAGKNIKMLSSRKARGVITGAGDNR